MKVMNHCFTHAVCAAEASPQSDVESVLGFFYVMHRVGMLVSVHVDIVLHDFYDIWRIGICF